MMARREPILLPPRREVERPLPRAVPLLALLGLLVLCFYTLPAVIEHERLERDKAQLEDQVRRAEDELSAMRRALQDAGEHGFLQKKATRDLLHQGRAYVKTRDAEREAARRKGP